MFGIKKEFKFEASHRLRNMPDGHPCGNLHGHSYKVKVSIEVENLNNNEMVTDFSNLKGFQNWLDEYFDHATILNKEDDKLFAVLKDFNFKVRTMPDGDPTAENMSKFFAEVLSKICDQLDIINKTITIEVFETEKNSATYQRKFITPVS